ncbi:MAG: hypothetical protein ACI4Q3_04465, partial [Kiritimatiellia bacterium]
LPKKDFSHSPLTQYILDPYCGTRLKGVGGARPRWSDGGSGKISAEDSHWAENALSLFPISVICDTMAELKGKDVVWMVQTWMV